MPRYLVMTAVVVMLSSGPALAQSSGQYRSALHEQYARAIELCNSLGWTTQQCRQNRTNVEEYCSRGTAGWCELQALIRDDAGRSPFPHRQITVEPETRVAPSAPGTIGTYPGLQQPYTGGNAEALTGTGALPQASTPQPGAVSQPLPLGATAPGTVTPAPSPNGGRTFNDVLQGLTPQ